MFKKGQVALEFLMTYGWAILVVLVAIGALAYFGVLSPDKFLPNKCTLPAGIACTDFKVDSSSGVSIVLRNGLGYDIDSVAVNMGPCASALTTTGDSRLANGEQQTWTGTAADCGLATSGGNKFSAAFSIGYDNVDSGLSHNTNGTMTSRVG